MVIRKKSAKARGVDSNRPAGKPNDADQKGDQFNFDFDLDIGEDDEIPDIIVERSKQQQPSINLGE